MTDAQDIATFEMMTNSTDELKEIFGETLADDEAAVMATKEELSNGRGEDDE